MKGKTIAIVAGAAVAAVLVWAALRTRPEIETPPAPTPPSADARDPMKAPGLEHMMEVEKIDAGPSANHELALFRDGDQVRVVVSEKLLEKLGADALPRLGMAVADETMSWDRYLRFLEQLHDILAESSPDHEAHGAHEHADDQVRGEEDADRTHGPEGHGDEGQEEKPHAE